MVLFACSSLAYAIDNQYPRLAPWALLVGALLDAAWYAQERRLQKTSFRIFKTYALQEAWLSSARFRNSMREDAFVALFEDCLRSKKWREDFAQMVSGCGFECRRDPMGDPPGVRCYWKLRYPLHWTNEQRIGALISCIGSVPNNKMWMVRDDDSSLRLETEIFELDEAITKVEQLPNGAKEFWFIFQRDLSRLIDIEIYMPSPKFTTGLNANVELSVPCVLPLSDNSFLHVAQGENGKLVATAERDGVHGSSLEYESASSLWEVWRHAVIVEKQEGLYVASVPEDVLTPEEKAAAQARATQT